jgi:hypothetical protein
VGVGVILYLRSRSEKRISSLRFCLDHLTTLVIFAARYKKRDGFGEKQEMCETLALVAREIFVMKTMMFIFAVPQKKCESSSKGF